MKLYLDTGNIKEIEEINNWGVLSGVTTNPSLLSKEGGLNKDTIRNICDMVKGPVSVEVTSLTPEEMVSEALELKEISPYLVIKIPATVEGLKATRALSEKGIPVNMTLIFSPSQALLAAEAGARYVSPFVGRLDDTGIEALEVVQDIREIFDIGGYDTEIIFASVRHPSHVIRAARIGADIATIPYRVFTLLIKHPMTELGLKKFMQDWNNLNK